MSKNLSQAAVQEFSSQVIAAYQAKGQLRNAVRRITGVVGNSYRFVVGSYGMAKQKSSEEDVKPLNISYLNPLAVLDNWHASEYTDIFDQATVNFDEKTYLAETVAGSIGRREDQIIINALVNSGTPNVIAAGGTGMTLAKLGTVAALFNGLNVPPKDRHILISPIALQGLLADERLTNIQYNSVRTLVEGAIDTFYGMQFHMIGTYDEGGLPLNGTIRSCYAWGKNSIGEAVGLDPRTWIDWIPQKTSWLTTCILRAGAVAIQPRGIVAINVDESVVPTDEQLNEIENKFNGKNIKTGAK